MWRNALLQEITGCRRQAWRVPNPRRVSTAFDGYSVGAAADEEEKTIPQACSSLDAAPEAPDKDRDFLKTGGVFTDACIEVTMKAATRCRASTHLPEFRMYCPPPIAETSGD